LKPIPGGPISVRQVNILVFILYSHILCGSIGEEYLRVKNTDKKQEKLEFILESKSSFPEIDIHARRNRADIFSWEGNAMRLGRISTRIELKDSNRRK
jgi:hypothetical protein